MKKILTALAFLTAGASYAAAVGVAYQNFQPTGTKPGFKNYIMFVSEKVTNTLTGDLMMSQGVVVNTGALSTRSEIGLTHNTTWYGVSGYSRVAIGERVTNTSNYGFYSIEPGISMPVGPVVVKAGYRFRSAFNVDAYHDVTRTAKVSISYSPTKVDTISIGFDRMLGDSEYSTPAITYIRRF